MFSREKNSENRRYPKKGVDHIIHKSLFEVKKSSIGVLQQYKFVGFYTIGVVNFSHALVIMFQA